MYKCMYLVKGNKAHELQKKKKSRWGDDVRNDLEKMKLIKWAGQVQDRLKCKDIVAKAKTLPEL